MSEFEFPLVTDEESVFPSNLNGSLCPVCEKTSLGLGRESAYIHGGALLLEELSSGVEKAQLIDSLEGFLFFDWNGPNNECADFELALNVKKGQFSLNFCSTSCLREFLNICVDNLEVRIREAKNA